VWGEGAWGETGFLKANQGRTAKAEEGGPACLTKSENSRLVPKPHTIDKIRIEEVIGGKGKRAQKGGVATSWPRGGGAAKKTSHIKAKQKEYERGVQFVQRMEQARDKQVLQQTLRLGET